MDRRRIFAWVTLFCFAVAAALPSFAAVLPKEDGSISIVICSADGFKTIEIEQASENPKTESHPRCDVCHIHCGMGIGIQLAGWTFPQAGLDERQLIPQTFSRPLAVALGPKLPRGPPLQDRQPYDRA